MTPAEKLEAQKKLCADIQNLAIPHASTAIQRVTASIGLTSIAPNDTLMQKDMVEAADAALYAAKRRGRNTVAVHGFVRASDDDMALAS